MSQRDKLVKFCRKPQVHTFLRSEGVRSRSLKKNEKDLSINIYRWDYTGAKNHDFFQILAPKFSIPVKDEGKS